MPTYPIKNLKTGETKELSMSMKEYSDWRDDPANSDWDKDWSQKTQQWVEYGDTFFSGTKYPDGHNRNQNPDWY